VGWPSAQHKLNLAQYAAAKILLGVCNASFGEGGYGSILIAFGMKHRLGTKVAERIVLARARLLSLPLDSPVSQAVQGCALLTGATWLDHARAVGRELQLEVDFLDYEPSMAILSAAGQRSRQ
jgi:hypothetical protein